MPRSRSGVWTTLAVVVALFLFAIPTLAEEPAAAGTDGDDEWDDSVEVIAELGGATSATLGSSSTALDPTRLPGTASTLTRIVSGTPGVSENGQGGHFQVFSIRGVSRHRVLSLVAGMRVHSERRAGASVSFVDPLLLGNVDVLRGPATTLHGAGALGGVVQVFPQSFSGGSVRLGYDSQGNENFQVLGYGNADWSVGFARREAVDGRTADGERLNSQFTQYSATLHRSWQRGSRRYELLFIPSRGRDIGKPNSDFPGRETNYPLERHQMLQFSVAGASGWRLQTHVHRHDLETEVVEGVTLNRVNNKSLDYGVRFERQHDVGERIRLRWGVALSGRDGVDADEVEQDLGPGGGIVGTLNTLDGAGEIESGGFLTVRWQGGKAGVESGVRVSRMDQRNSGFAGVDGSALSGYVGVGYHPVPRVELRGNVSSGLRFASLSELFFSGTTGAGGVIGNPDLERERSLNVETSIRWLGRRLLVNGSLFRNEIDDYIERMTLAGGGDVKTFANLGSGTLRGVELQGVLRPNDSWIVDFGGHRIEGRDDSDVPLADVPPDQVYMGLHHRRGGWSLETRWTHRAAKNDPGDGEVAIRSARLLRASVTRRLPGAWSLTLSGSNLLNESYFSSADDKSSMAPGGSVGLLLVRSGG